MNRKIISITAATLFILSISQLSVSAYDKDKLTYSLYKDNQLQAEIYTDKNYDFKKEITYKNEKYELVENTDTNTKVETPSTEKKSITKEVANQLFNKSDYELSQAPQTIKVKDGDKEYTATAKSISYDTSIIRNRTKTANYTVNYYSNDSEPSVPQTVDFNTFDEATGNNVTVTAPLQSLEKTNEYWKKIDDEFYFIAKKYDSDKITMNVNGKKIEINKNGDSPIDSSYFNDLLTARGMNTSVYRLNSLVWSGEPYKENGILCRKAVGDCEHKVSDYTATYGGTVSLPDYNGYKADVIYEYEVTKTDTIIKNTALYKKYILPTEAPTEKITETPTEAPTEETPVKKVITIGIGLVLASLIAVITVFLIQRKRKE